MADSDDDTPIEKVDFCYGVKVVDIAEMRVARGQSKRPFERCQHIHLTYCTDERRVYCEDCKKTISGFDAFVSLVNFFDKQIRALQAREEKIKEAEKNNLRRLVTKALDTEWQKLSTVPCCPHCSAGLLPEDFTGKRVRTTGRDMEAAKRRRLESEKNNK